jgi:hypothetical protein
VTSWTFFTAYFRPQKQVLVEVNYYGEANFEKYFLIVILVIAVSGYILYLNELRTSHKKEA